MTPAIPPTLASVEQLRDKLRLALDHLLTMRTMRNNARQKLRDVTADVYRWEQGFESAVNDALCAQEFLEQADAREWAERHEDQVARAMGPEP